MMARPARSPSSGAFRGTMSPPGEAAGLAPPGDRPGGGAMIGAWMNSRRF
jgi:hypothetical protein